jgi:hypothetical protein
MKTEEGMHNRSAPFYYCIIASVLIGRLFKMSCQPRPKTAPVAIPWEVLGPGGGGGTFVPTFHPANPEKIVLRTDMSGTFLSENGGKSWQCVLKESPYVYAVTADTRVPGRLFCNTFTHGAWRSDDRGESWRKLRGYNFHQGTRAFPDPADTGMVYLTTNGASVFHGPARTVDK